MPGPVGTIPFVQFPADFKIGEPVEIYIDGQLSSCMRLRDWRIMLARGNLRTEEYDATNADVVPIKGR
jgi:hypothetical protein